MKLPDKPTPAKQSFSDLSVLLYGRPKIGKTTFCSRLPSAIFLATEAGLGHVDAYQVQCSSWPTFVEAIDAIAAGEHSFRTVVVDTVDNAYRMCRESVCAENRIDHESDAKWGKGFTMVNSEFHRTMTRLSMLPIGVWFVSHAQAIDIEIDGKPAYRAIPTLPDKARQVINGMVDQILYADLEDVDGKSRRVLRAKPSQIYEAGDRTGRLPATLDFAAKLYMDAMTVKKGGTE